MNKNIENIDRYLKGVELPEHVSYQHQQRLRREILGKIERRQTMSVRAKSWKYAAVIALICTGIAAATVVGVKIHKWRFLKEHPEAGYILVSEDGLKAATIPESWADNPEHAVEVKEELDLLKQQGAGELMSVLEKEVNGKLISRTFISKYILADGREIKSGDRDPDFKESMTEAQEDELISLLRADEYVTIGFEQKEFGGRMFSFERNQFILRDGTEVIWSKGIPSEDRQDTVRTVVRDPEEAEQILKEKREIEILRQQDKRQLIGVKELMANGELDLRVFIYQYELSDGRTRDIAEGGAVNDVLNKEQRQEWRQCKNKGSGEDLGTYEEKVNGLLFVFKRQRFTLSDGTELTWSYGTLKNDP